MASAGLTRDSQFREVYRNGQKETGHKIIICYLKKDGEGIKPGFVASKKKVGKAYQRNRAKRLMREVFRSLKERIIEKDIWIIFIATFRPAETSFRELLEEVESSMIRAGLISSGG